jgi:shikimate dehydrogenase
MISLKACLIGDNIKYSVSPDVYNFFGKELSIDVEYEILNLKEHQLSEFVTHAKKNLTGFNITMPHKQNIIKHLDKLDSSVLECGACNAIKNQNGMLIGYNTDGGGVILALKLNGFDVYNKNVLMLGAGGAAMSIAKSLEKKGAKNITLLNRTLKNAQDLCKKLSCDTHFDLLNDQNLNKYINNANLLINASVLGQTGYNDFLDFDFLDKNKDIVIFDINYSNPLAKLPIEAKRRSLKYINGKWMVACQAVEVMSIWFGLEIADKTVEKLVNSL